MSVLRFRAVVVWGIYSRTVKSFDHYVLTEFDLADAIKATVTDMGAR